MFHPVRHQLWRAGPQDPVHKGESRVVRARPGFPSEPKGQPSPASPDQSGPRYTGLSRRISYAGFANWKLDGWCHRNAFLRVLLSAIFERWTLQFFEIMLFTHAGQSGHSCACSCCTRGHRGLVAVAHCFLAASNFTPRWAKRWLRKNRSFLRRCTGKSVSSFGCPGQARMVMVVVCFDLAGDVHGPFLFIWYRLHGWLSCLTMAILES